MRHRAVALILAAALSFSLAGCFGLGDKSEDSTGLTNMLTDMAENAAEIARELEGIDWSKTVRAVVYDADGTQVAEITDQTQIDEIFSPLSQVNGLAPTPDAEREYVVEIWEPETVKLGQSADDVGEYKGLEVVTYEGSDVVTLTVVPISLSINLSSEGGVADAIRALSVQK